ncbi:hypothetical protein MPSEU_000872300 [Mayamaea pseudoterrestris]|nr:hypothetical protein MPSEU_000872300 [Mayamaea pseudoterrestris]
MQQQQLPRRVPGLLRFLPDQVTLYAHDAIVWTETTKRLRPGARRKREQQQQQHDSVTSPCMVDLLDLVNGKNIVVLLFMDLTQQHSLAIRKALVRLAESHSQQVACIVIASESEASSSETFNGGGDHEEKVGSSSSSTSRRATQPVETCLCGSGFGYTRLTPTLQACFNVTQLPYLVVLHHGRRISGSHEELALEWNEADAIVDAWSRQTSALSVAQRVQASLLFPQCIVS